MTKMLHLEEAEASAIERPSGRSPRAAGSDGVRRVPRPSPTPVT
jgi:hypothetical protein